MMTFVFTLKQRRTIREIRTMMVAIDIQKLEPKLLLRILIIIQPGTASRIL